MNHKGTQKIETERLILRKFEISDAADMFKNYAGHKKVTEFVTWNAHKNIEETERYLNDVVLPNYKNNNSYRWAIILKEINEVIGCIDVVKSDDERKMAELGWVIGEKFWGQGIMPEAGMTVLKYLFEVGYERIQAICDVNNPKSGRVMQKIGMEHEGVLKKYERNHSGKLVDCDIWAIVK